MLQCFIPTAQHYVWYIVFHQKYSGRTDEKQEEREEGGKEREVQEAEGQGGQKEVMVAATVRKTSQLPQGHADVVDCKVSRKFPTQRVLTWPLHVSQGRSMNLVLTGTPKVIRQLICLVRPFAFTSGYIMVYQVCSRCYVHGLLELKGNLEPFYPSNQFLQY